MIKSMTGFGRGNSSDGIHSFEVEIKTVNHRYNDINIKMPKYLNFLEEDTKSLIKKKLSRGRIEVFVKLEKEENQDVDIRVDLNLAKSYKESLDLIRQELGIEKPVKLDNILSIADVLKLEKKEEDEELILKTLTEAVDMAMDQVLEMRKREGESLEKDIRHQVETINTYIDEINTSKDFVVEEYREKLEDRIRNILDDEYKVDEERLANEVAFLADKSDINEEIVRLDSHIKQLLGTLEADEPVGRRLDFLIQEINREVNTIGSKSSNILISQNVVNIKSEIEKIREQVQNIE